MSHRLQAFVVEDSPIIRDNLVATLEEMVELDAVGSADNESDAVEWLQGHSQCCDLVILDLFLAGGSGLGVLQSLKDLPGRPKCVVFTNYATPDMRRRCKALGADRVFDKSREIEGLLDYCSELASHGGGSSPPLC